MLTFLHKDYVWDCMDQGLHEHLGWTGTSMHLKSWQDIAVYRYLVGRTGLNIAEIGGGNSRILRKLAPNNTCINIDKFEGADGGPTAPPDIEGVENVFAFMGEFSPSLKDASMDAVYSVSVIEHVPEAAAADFLDDMVRILKPGGMALHAIDLYVGDTPSSYAQSRLDLYNSWLDHPDLLPLSAVRTQRAAFSCSMVSNPDLTMWNWNRSSPTLSAQRKTQQSVSLLLGAKKKLPDDT